MASSSQFALPSPFTWLLRQIENPKVVKINVRSEGVAIFHPPTTPQTGDALLSRPTEMYPEEL